MDNSLNINSNHQYTDESNETTVTSSKTSRYLSLDLLPSSVSAKLLINSVTHDVAHIIGARRLKKLSNAVAAIVAATIACLDNGDDGYCYRSLAAGSFTGLAIGYRSFKDALIGLVRLEYVHHTLGYFRQSGPSHASQFRAEVGLLIRAASFGITSINWQSHFTRDAPPKVIAAPVVLRAARLSWRGEAKGRSLPISWDNPKVMTIKRQVDAINAFFGGVRVEGGEHYGFKRIFGNGNLPDFDWNMGGRLYSLGDSYQQLATEARCRMRLNGESVVELDIAASHLTIINALVGDGGTIGAEYNIEGIPRNVVKAWVTMCLGYGKFHTRWSKEAIRRYHIQSGSSLEQDYPLPNVKHRLQCELPTIGRALGSGLCWGPLQYLESCAIIDAVEKLAYDHDVPALPVHDSLIVPVYGLHVAKDVLAKAFHSHVGIYPRLCVKS